MKSTIIGLSPPIWELRMAMVVSLALTFCLGTLKQNAGAMANTIGMFVIEGIQKAYDEKQQKKARLYKGRALDQRFEA